MPCGPMLVTRTKKACFRRRKNTAPCSHDTTIDIGTRLRVGEDAAKKEREVARQLRVQLRGRGYPDVPQAVAPDGKGNYCDNYRSKPGASVTLFRNWGDHMDQNDLPWPVETLWLEDYDGWCHWQPSSRAMTAGPTDHIWTIKGLPTAVELLLLPMSQNLGRETSN